MTGRSPLAACVYDGDIYSLRRYLAGGAQHMYFLRLSGRGRTDDTVSTTSVISHHRAYSHYLSWRRAGVARCRDGRATPSFKRHYRILRWHAISCSYTSSILACLISADGEYSGDAWRARRGDVTTVVKNIQANNAASIGIFLLPSVPRRGGRRPRNAHVYPSRSSGAAAAALRSNAC